MNIYWIITNRYLYLTNCPGDSVVKNPPTNAGDSGSTPGSGKSPGEGNGTHSSILVWETPWTEKPGELLSMELQELYMTKQLNNNTTYI